MIEVWVSNACFPHEIPESCQLVSTSVQGKCFGRDTGFMLIPVAIPDIRLNRDRFYCLVSNDTRSTCKVHIRKVKTIYSCNICGVRMCPEPCVQMYHTIQEYSYDDESRDGPGWLNEARGRPYQRGRRSLRN